MDTQQQTYILTQAELKLSNDIEESELENGVVIIKHIPTKNYLVLEAEELFILRKFKHSLTMQSLVPSLISDRKCIPLRNLYELILKAVMFGILYVDGENKNDQPRVEAVEWEHTLRFGFAHYFGYAGILSGVFALLIQGITIPTHFLHIALGYLAVCVAISLGYLLSACLLRGFDREVYNFRFLMLTPFPHFFCNVEDGCMAGSKCEISVALAQMAPLFTVAAISAVWYPPIAYLLLLGMFLQTAPDGKSPFCLLMRALYRKFPLSTTRDFLFVQNRVIWTLINNHIKFADKKYLLLFSFCTILWLFTVLFSNLRVFNLNAVDLWTKFVSHNGIHIVSVLLLTSTGILILGSVAFLAWILFNNLVNTFEEIKVTRQKRFKIKRDLELTTTDIVDFLREDCLLLREMGLDSLEEIANRVEGHIVCAKQYVFRQGEPGDRLYFVFEGKVEVIHNLKSGRPLRITTLKKGDVFGEIALIENIARTRSIRTASRSLLLSLSREDFQQLIIRNLGVQQVKEIVEKESFLNRIPLCSNWHPQAMVRFAQLGTFSEFKASETVIQKGRANQFFYLIYDGILEVKEGTKTLAKLSTGQFFGEISLLQNSVSTADVVAKIDSRCFLISRKDFLKFLGTDFLIGLQFEDITSKRLKHPVFPLTGINYDEALNR